MTKDKIQAFTLRITNANRTQMVAILYEIGIEYLEDAKAALMSKDIDKFTDELHRFRGVLRELMNSVNTESETGRAFMSLYIFAGKEVTTSFLNKDSEPLNHIISMFNKMKDAYELAGEKDQSGPVMTNTESVYSGFTYNKNLVNENLNNQDLSRGFLA